MTTAQERLNQILPSWYSLLTQWSLDGSLVAAATDALQLDSSNAKEGSQELLQSYVSQWSAGNFNSLPQIVLLSAEDISGAQGAYAASTGTIYLNQDWLLTASDEEIRRVLTEELGHFLDSQLNLMDTPGDEGERFSARVYEGFDSQSSLTDVANDSDLFSVYVEGVPVEAEASSTQASDQKTTDILRGSSTLGTLVYGSTQTPVYLGTDYIVTTSYNSAGTGSASITLTSRVNGSVSSFVIAAGGAYHEVSSAQIARLSDGRVAVIYATSAGYDYEVGDSSIFAAVLNTNGTVSEARVRIDDQFGNNTLNDNFNNIRLSLTADLTGGGFWITLPIGGNQSQAYHISSNLSIIADKIVVAGSDIVFADVDGIRIADPSLSQISTYNNLGQKVGQNSYDTTTIVGDIRVVGNTESVNTTLLPFDIKTSSLLSASSTLGTLVYGSTQTPVYLGTDYIVTTSYNSAGNGSASIALTSRVNGSVSSFVIAAGGAYHEVSSAQIARLSDGRVAVIYATSAGYDYEVGDSSIFAAVLNTNGTVSEARVRIDDQFGNNTLNDNFNNIRLSLTADLTGGGFWITLPIGGNQSQAYHISSNLSIIADKIVVAGSDIVFADVDGIRIADPSLSQISTYNNLGQKVGQNSYDTTTIVGDIRVVGNTESVNTTLLPFDIKTSSLLSASSTLGTLVYGSTQTPVYLGTDYIVTTSYNSAGNGSASIALTSRVNGSVSSFVIAAGGAYHEVSSAQIARLSDGRVAVIYATSAGYDYEVGDSSIFAAVLNTNGTVSEARVRIDDQFGNNTLNDNFNNIRLSLTADLTGGGFWITLPIGGNQSQAYHISSNLSIIADKIVVAGSDIVFADVDGIRIADPSLSQISTYNNLGQKVGQNSYDTTTIVGDIRVKIGSNGVATPITTAGESLYTEGCLLIAGIIRDDPDGISLPAYAYQWYKDGVAIATNGTSSTYVVPIGTGAGTYKVAITYTDNQNFRTTVESGTRDVVAAEGGSGTPGSISSSTGVFTEGVTLTAPTVTGDPDGDSGSPAYAYQWYKDGVAIATNGTSSTYVVPIGTGAGTYKVAITYTDNQNFRTTVESGTRDVVAAEGGSGTPGSISSSTGVFTEGVTLTAPTVTGDPDGDSGSPAYAYQWYKDGVAIATNGTSSTYVVPIGTGAGTYKVAIIYTDNQNFRTTVESGTRDVVAAEGGSGTPGSISSSTGVFTEGVTLTAPTVTGDPDGDSGSPAYAYQWYKDGVAIATNGTSSTYVVPIGTGAGTYKVAIIYTDNQNFRTTVESGTRDVVAAEGGSGTPGSISSSTGVFTEGVTLTAPTVTGDPDGDSGSPAYAYQWYKDGVAIATNGTSSTYVVPIGTGAGTYKVAITYTDNQNFRTTVESGTRDVVAAEGGSGTPGSISSSTGVFTEGVTLTAPTVTGDPDGDSGSPAYAYQWYKDGVAIATNGTSSTYVVPIGTGAGTYKVAIIYTDNQNFRTTVESGTRDVVAAEGGSGTPGSISSSTGVFTEGVTLTAPTVTGDPDGDSGSPAYAYQWYKDGVAIATNGTSSTYVVPIGTGAGTYKVAIIYTDNQNFRTTVESGTRDVVAAEGGSGTPGSISSSTGVFTEGVTLTAPTVTGDPDGDSGSPAYAYQWYKDGVAIATNGTSSTYVVPIGTGAGTYKVAITYTDNQNFRTTVESGTRDVVAAVVTGPTTGNDNLTASASGGLISGVPSTDPTRGKGTKDKLTGGTGVDTFVLGTTSGVFYNDGITTNAGINDYGYISGFTIGTDKIQLAGSASQYRLVNTSTIPDPVTGALVSGVGIYLNDGTGSGSKSTAWDGKDELIGFVAGVTTTSLGSLSGSTFVYASTSSGPDIVRTPITGTPGSDGTTVDPITGTSGNEAFSLIGATSNLGTGQLDFAKGNGGKDLFVLGDSQGVFYKDASTTTAGTTDLLWIKDFNADDQVQLKGTSGSYKLQAINLNGATGTGIFLNDGSGSGSSKSAWDSKDELIGFLEGVSDASLANTAQFIYVA